jgi:hypothetical protein
MRISFIKIRAITFFDRLTQQCWRKKLGFSETIVQYVEQSKGQFFNQHFFIYIFKNKIGTRPQVTRYADTDTQNGTETEASKQIWKYCVLHSVQIFQY